MPYGWRCNWFVKSIRGNIWEFRREGEGKYIVIPTNGSVKSNGECVMGRGLAFQAKVKFPNLPKELGERIKQYGNQVFLWTKYRLITFPVKHNWWEKADINLIIESCNQLMEIFKYNLTGLPTPVYLPKVGCGNGKLNWSEVEPFLEQLLDDRFIVCEV